MHMGIIVNVLLQGRMPLSGGFFAMKKTHYPTFGTFRLFTKNADRLLRKVETVKKTTM